MYQKIKKEIESFGFLVVSHDFERPWGIAAIIYTDIDRDGVLEGLNLPSTVAWSEAISLPVIASGGLSSIDDIKALIAADCAGLEGAISGRALYDGRLDPAEAIALLKGAD